MKINLTFAHNRAYIVTGLVCLLSFVIAVEYSKPLLTSRLIQFLDNKPLALDAPALTEMLIARREIRKIQFGVMNQETKKLEGLYEFQGRKCCIRELALYERECHKEYMEKVAALDQKYVNCDSFRSEWQTTRSALITQHEQDVKQEEDIIKRTVTDPDEAILETARNHKRIAMQHEQNLAEQEEIVKRKYTANKTAYMAELDVIKNEYHQKLALVHPALQKAKVDFCKSNEPFSAKMAGTRAALIKIVGEFCMKYKRPYSFLLEWADIKVGEEFIVFDKTVSSCQQLDVICTDESDFLEALFYSCPKARKDLETKQQKK